MISVQEQAQARHFAAGDTIWNQGLLPFLECHLGEEKEQGHLKDCLYPKGIKLSKDFVQFLGLD